MSARGATHVPGAAPTEIFTDNKTWRPARLDGHGAGKTLGIDSPHSLPTEKMPNGLEIDANAARVRGIDRITYESSRGTDV